MAKKFGMAGVVTRLEAGEKVARAGWERKWLVRENGLIYEHGTSDDGAWATVWQPTDEDREAVDYAVVPVVVP